MTRSGQRSGMTRRVHQKTRPHFDVAIRLSYRRPPASARQTLQTVGGAGENCAAGAPGVIEQQSVEGVPADVKAGRTGMVSDHGRAFRPPDDRTAGANESRALDIAPDTGVF